MALANSRLTFAITQKEGFLSSLRLSPVLNDYYLEVIAEPNICRSNDSYGLLARAIGSDSYYRFAVSCNGDIRLERVKSGQYTILQDWTPSGSVSTGPPARILLGVWAYGQELRFFVNGVYQLSVKGVNWPSGQIGMFARAAGEQAVTVSFSDLTIF